MSSELVRPNLTIRTMQLNAWVANNYEWKSFFYLLYYNGIILKCLKSHSTLSITYLLHTRISCEHNNKWIAWAAVNLAPLDMPFLSITYNLIQ